MAKKEMKKEKHFLFNYVSLGLMLVFLIIPIMFFFLLSTKVPEETFGIAEIFYSIIFSVLITAFLMWEKSVAMKNPYLGTIIGIIALSVFEYSLFLKYSGTYTTIFAGISSLIVLGFLGYNFYKGLTAKKLEKDDYYEDDSEE